MRDVTDVEPRIERLQPQHFAPLAELFARVFHRHAGEEHLRRKYDTHRLGVERICHVAMVGSRAVAFTGMIPQRFLLDGEEVLAAHACDYVTDPDWRRKGLHRMLEERSRRLALDHGVRLIYALLTDQSLAVARKTGWTLLQTMHRYSVSVTTLPLARFCFGTSPALWRRYCRWAGGVIRASFPAADGRANSLLDEGRLCQSYDEDLVRYETFTANHRIDLGGPTAWIKLAPQLLVGDLDAPDPTSVRGSLRTLTRLARRLGIDEIGFMVCPDTRLDDCLGRLLAAEDGWIVAHLGSELPVERLRVNLSDYDTF